MARPRNFDGLREKTDAQVKPSQAPAPDLLAKSLEKRKSEKPVAQEKAETPGLLAESSKKRAEEQIEQGRQEALHLQTMDDLRRDKSRNPNSRVAGLTFASFDEFDGEPEDSEDNTSALEFLKHSKHHRPDRAENFVNRVYSLTLHELHRQIAHIKDAARHVKGAAEHALHGKEHAGTPRPAKFKLRNHAGTATAVTGMVLGDLFIAGSKGYLEGRVGGLAHGGHVGSRDAAYASAGKAVVADAGGAIAGAALTLVPGYTSYQEAKQGNYGQALFWGAIDALGVVAMIVPIAGEAVEGSIIAAKVARAGVAVGEVTNVALDAQRVHKAAQVVEVGAKAVNRANMAGMAYDGVTLANDFRERLNTKEGRLALKLMTEEAFKNGATKETLAEVVRAKLESEGLPPAFASMAANHVQKEGMLTPVPTPKGPPMASLRTAIVDTTPKPKPVDGSQVPIPVS